MIQDPNIERLIAKAVDPLKEEIKTLKSQIKDLQLLIRNNQNSYQQNS